MLADIRIFFVYWPKRSKNLQFLSIYAQKQFYIIILPSTQL